MRIAKGLPRVAVVVLGMVLPAQAWNTHQLVLQQGQVPTIDGVPLALPAYSGTVDTYIDKDNPTVAYSTDSLIRIGGGVWTVNQSLHPKRGYLTFSGFESYIPTGAKVVNAQLNLSAAGYSGSGSGSTVSFRTASWSAADTWNAPPVESRQQIGTANMYDGWGYYWDAAHQTQSMNVTPLVQSWQAAPATNYGFQFRCNEDGTSYMEHDLYSADYTGDIAKRPKLTIDFVQPDSLIIGGYDFRRDVKVLSGPTVIADTVISADGLNHSTDEQGDLRTYNNGGTPRRGLFKILTSNPELAVLAKTGQPLGDRRPQLVSAKLMFNVDLMNEWFDLWKCAQNWTPATATNLTTDGATPWASAWVDSAISNNDGASLGQLGFDFNLKAGTASWDITSILQGYIDGTTPNYGFILGQTTGAAYLNRIFMTDSAVALLRPTLVLEILVPEPATLALLGLAVTAALRRPRRR